MVEKLSAQKSEGLAVQQQYKGKDAVPLPKNGLCYLYTTVTRCVPFFRCFRDGAVDFLFKRDKGPVKSR